uniref:Protein kinase domain-containing protein n=1 Tax=Salarias fasciatus TaxID=181472 RepID=A0A672J0B7_SALFA
NPLKELKQDAPSNHDSEFVAMETITVGIWLMSEILSTADCSVIKTLLWRYNRGKTASESCFTMNSNENTHIPGPSAGAKHSYIPKSYKVIEQIGKGEHCVVYRCLKRETNEEVAVRQISRQKYYFIKALMAKKLDEANIVKFYGELYVDGVLSLEYELLDISLIDWLVSKNEFILLDEIRVIIKQLTVALDGLKRAGVIHADLKMDNIMLVDRIKRPLRVKIIDFGLSLITKQAITGDIHQITRLRAPELLFGLPFSEPIDIWSLGCLMGEMLCYLLFFKGHSAYETLQNIIGVLGPPPQHLLDAGLYTQYFFKKDRDSWTLKTPKEDCVDLIKAMLRWDAKERITPDGILKHPFITRSSASWTHSSPSTHEPLRCLHGSEAPTIIPDPI